jgi:predicted esterase
LQIKWYYEKNLDAKENPKESYILLLLGYGQNRNYLRSSQGCKENPRPSSAVARTRGKSKIFVPLAGCGEKFKLYFEDAK